jgi:hypothetical protein
MPSDSPRTEREDLLQDLALKLDLANMELQTIDSILARRPALGGFAQRTEKIEHAIVTAGRYDGLLRKYGKHKDGCLFRLECTCGWDLILKELREAYR